MVSFVATIALPDGTPLTPALHIHGGYATRPRLHSVRGRLPDSCWSSLRSPVCSYQADRDFSARAALSNAFQNLYQPPSW